jgi:acetyl-CoA carboxylase biotin carboxyl carrier protein
MIDIRKLKELVRLMVANDLSELDLRDSEEQVTLRRDGRGLPVVETPVVVAAPTAAASPAAAAAPPPESPADTEEGLIRIESPIVGTFFAASSPDAAPLVSVGAAVSPESVVCLVEAMKIFNEIKAECTGTVQKILVENGEAVEFGQPLMLIKPT